MARLFGAPEAVLIAQTSEQTVVSIVVETVVKGGLQTEP